MRKIKKKIKVGRLQIIFLILFSIDLFLLLFSFNYAIKFTIVLASIASVCFNFAYGLKGSSDYVAEWNSEQMVGCLLACLYVTIVFPIKFITNDNYLALAILFQIFLVLKGHYLLCSFALNLARFLFYINMSLLLAIVDFFDYLYKIIGRRY